MMPGERNERIERLAVLMAQPGLFLRADDAKLMASATESEKAEARQFCERCGVVVAKAAGA